MTFKPVPPPPVTDTVWADVYPEDVPALIAVMTPLITVAVKPE